MTNDEFFELLRFLENSGEASPEYEKRMYAIMRRLHDNVEFKLTNLEKIELQQPGSVLHIDNALVPKLFSN